VAEALEARIMLTDPIAVISPGPGVPSEVRLFDATGAVVDSVLVYGPGFLGGARVATADVNHDGTFDVIAGAGTSGGPHIKVLDGTNLRNELHSFFAFDPGFTGGVFVSAADFNGDNKADIIVGADAGGGPHVKVFDGVNLSVLFSFFAFDSSFTGGVRVAAGLIDNNNIPDIIVGAGPGGGPHVRVLQGDVAQGPNPLEVDDALRSFYAYDPGFLGGVFVAGADVLGDSLGRDDIITGPGAGGGPHLRVWEGPNSAKGVRAVERAELLFEFFVEPPEGSGPITTGLRVAGVDIDGDGREEIVVATDKNVFVYELVTTNGDGTGGGNRTRLLSENPNAGLGVGAVPRLTVTPPDLNAFIAGIPPGPSSQTSSSLTETEPLPLPEGLTPDSLVLLATGLDSQLIDAALADEETLAELLSLDA
jgi:hypothetical protein